MKLRKPLLQVLSLFLMVSCVSPVLAQESEDPDPADENSALQLESDPFELQTEPEAPQAEMYAARNAANEISLYAIGSNDEEFVTIPSGYPSSWQLPSSSYQIVNNPDDCITISASGLVSPKLETWYNAGSYWINSYIEGAPFYTEVKTGTATLSVTTAGRSETYTIRVYDYAYDIYPDLILSPLIAQYIPENPTPYQVLEGAARIAASFDYRRDASSWQGMMIHNGGDCWASTSLILKLCADYGIEAKARSANRDPGAGSGHANVIAKIGSQYYIADAGYSESAPRYYDLFQTDGFSYSPAPSNGYVIYQYDGFENEVQIPSLRGSQPVVQLDSSVFSGGVTRVIIPASIRSIRTMYLDDPYIRYGAFSTAADLLDIQADAANAAYCDIDGVLFTRDRKTLVQFPAGRTGTYTIPEGTETIGAGAFCRSKLDTINVPASVKTVSDCAFIDTKVKKISFQGERPQFGSYCFYLSSLTVESQSPWEGMDSFDFGPGTVTYVCPALLKPLIDASLSGILPEYTWTGYAIEPEPVLVYENTTLIKGTDYTVRYENNTAPGTARVIVTGTGRFTGTKTIEFRIVKPAVKVVVMHRLYNPHSGEHFYTGSDNEKNFLIVQGWKYEGVGWKAPERSSTPVYRLYNPNGSDHHYTISLKERNYLIQAGWKYEGVGWYSDDAQGVPLYRQYNPNARTGSHNYTTDKRENDFLVRNGWNAEGIGWYGIQ